LLQLGPSADNVTISFSFSNHDRIFNCADNGSSRFVAARGANPDNRLAWVITESEYPQLGEPLPYVDAMDRKHVTELLSAGGFQVITSANRTDRELSADYERFRHAVRAQSWRVVLVYFSGHGVSLANRNYFVPSDGLAPTVASVSTYFDIGLVVKFLDEDNRRFSIVLVDTCRTTTPDFAEPVADVVAANVLVNFSSALGQKAYPEHDLDGSAGSLWTTKFLAIAASNPEMRLDQIVLYTDRYVFWETENGSLSQKPVFYPPTSGLPAPAFDPNAVRDTVVPLD
jgi:caspase domain-containing protein